MVTAAAPTMPSTNRTKIVTHDSVNAAFNIFRHFFACPFVIESHLQRAHAQAPRRLATENFRWK
jgi:hypothetical protein